MHKMVVAIWGEYANYRIAEVLARADRTNLRAHTDALAENGFTAYPQL
jgi:hypothetical protein